MTPATDATGALEVPFPALGLPLPVRLTGISAATSFFLPVPSGLSPATLTGTATVAVGTQSGTVEFSSDGHRLAVVHVAADASGGAADFSVPLAGLIPVAGLVRLDVQSSLPLDDRFCQGQFVTPELRLDALAVHYSGAATVPTTVAGFLPPFLSVLRVWLPNPPTNAAIEGAIKLVDATVARYRASPVRVEVRTLGPGLPDPGAFDLLARDVVFQPGDVAPAPPMAQVVAATGGSPLLVFSGDADGLRHQVDATAGAILALAATDRVTASGQLIPQLIPAAEQTLAKLGLATLEAHGEGRLQFTVSFSQSDFGGMVRWIRLHVRGTHTPVPAAAAASVNVFFNNVLVATAKASTTGSFALAPVIATTAIARDNTVDIRFEYTPADGLCARAAQPVDVQLSADASVETRPGVSLPIGFQRLPQALLPDPEGAVDVLAPDRASAIINLFAELQRMTRTPITPRMVTIARAVAETQPAVIVTTNPALLTGLHPTVDLSTATPNLVVNSSPARVQVGTADAIAQVFTDRGRYILAVETRPDAAASLGPLIDSLVGQPGLPGLGHDAGVLVGPLRLADVAVHDTLSPPVPVVFRRPAPLRWWEWLAVLPVPIVAGVAGIRFRRRRPRAGRDT